VNRVVQDFIEIVIDLRAGSVWIRRTILEKLGEQLPENQVEK
jgi:hypothetical protein